MLPLLEIKNLTVDFPATGSPEPVLQNFSMTLRRGELLAIVGESGSGKSVMALTIMNLLSTAARIKSGSIRFSPDGVLATELVGLPEKKLKTLRGNQLAMVFQEPMTSLNPVMTCGAQVVEPLMQHKKLNRKQAGAEALSWFEKVRLPEPAQLFNRYPHQLSGGQKQRVMIAMAISCNPALLICDEPTTALDVRVQRTIVDLLKDLRRTENIGMIFITHDLSLVADIADYGMVMLRGRTMEAGPVDQLLIHPQHAYTKGLLRCRPALHVKGERLPLVSDFLDGKPKTTVRESHDVPGDEQKKDAVLGSLMPPGNERKKDAVSPDVLLRVQGLHLRYASGTDWLGRQRNGPDVVHDATFDVYRGETLGLVGESGSGKTTLGRALLGLAKPYQGSIRYNDTDLTEMPVSALLKFRKHIQIVFQDPYSSLNPRLPVGQAIAEPFQVHESLNKKQRKERVLDLLHEVDLKPGHYSRYPHEFSGGQRQRIVIARALALRPGFVVFDESVSALDVSVQAQILNLINDLKKNFGFTAVFISHDLSVIRYLCDRVMVMEKGVLVESGDVDSVYGNPQTAYTRSLIDAIPGRNIGRLSGE